MTFDRHSCFMFTFEISASARDQLLAHVTPTSTKVSFLSFTKTKLVCFREDPYLNLMCDLYCTQKCLECQVRRHAWQTVALSCPSAILFTWFSFEASRQESRTSFHLTTSSGDPFLRRRSTNAPCRSNSLVLVRVDNREYQHCICTCLC